MHDTSSDGHISDSAPLATYRDASILGKKEETAALQRQGEGPQAIRGSAGLAGHFQAPKIERPRRKACLRWHIGQVPWAGSQDIEAAAKELEFSLPVKPSSTHDAPSSKISIRHPLAPEVVQHKPCLRAEPEATAAAFARWLIESGQRLAIPEEGTLVTGAPNVRCNTMCRQSPNFHRGQ